MSANESVQTPHPLHLDGLDYRLGDRQLFADLSLTLRSRESVAVLGPSGSGKSTLLSIVLGLIRPHSGTVSVAGQDLGTLNQTARTRLRAHAIGMVFQFGELLPELGPADNVALAAMLAGDRSDDVLDRARELLSLLGVPDAPTVETLSGGERQRVAVARALINEPQLLLADEPTGALDESNRDKVAELLFGLPAARGCALLVVTHDRSVAARADRVLTIADGSLVPETGERPTDGGS